MDRSEFFAGFVSLLHDLRPGLNLPDPAPDTSLWHEGYLDSLSMIEVIFFLEEILGREISPSEISMRHFSTMETIYEAYVASYIPS